MQVTGALRHYANAPKNGITAISNFFDLTDVLKLTKAALSQNALPHVISESYGTRRYCSLRFASSTVHHDVSAGCRKLEVMGVWVSF
jgi:hypothetical protein